MKLGPWVTWVVLVEVFLINVALWVAIAMGWRG